MNVRGRSPRDFFAGAIFLLFGSCAVPVGRDYKMGTAFHMGSGYFPIVLGALLLILGAGIRIKSLVVTGEKRETVDLRPLPPGLSVGVFPGIGFAVVAMGLFGFSEIIANPERRENAKS